LPKISVQLQKNKIDVLCIGMKVLFSGCAKEEGCSNEWDFKLYSNQEDRYSVLSFCTEEKLPEPLASVSFFSHRRVRTFDEFKNGLLEVKLALKSAK
jgi:hypothetical protein